ncbi:MAG: hypothetical protein Q9191_005019 [Dirinaria sp. TL-2023a]
MPNERYSISIAELVVYVILFPLSTLVIFRHGMGKSSGWIYLGIFCGIRIASSALGIVSYHHPNSQDDLVWYSILGGVGISPLLLASKGLLTRVNEHIGSKYRVLALRILHLPNILALILSIIGGTRLDSSSSDKVSQGKKLTQAGIIIFLVVFALMAVLAFLTFTSLSAIPSGEKRILFGVLLALPFIFVRILYSVLADFVDSSTFRLIDGNPTAQLCMSIVEEMIVAVLYIATGLTADSMRDDMSVKGQQQQQYPMMRV